MRAYLDAMDTALYHGPEPPDRVPVVLAALGPKMLDLARDRTDGAHPYFVPVEHTAQARERLGAGKLLAPEQAVILTDDESRARELIREHVAFYMTAPNYRNSMLRLGFEEADLDDGGSERLQDAIVAWGDEDRDPRARAGPPRRGCRPRLHPDPPVGRARPRRAAPARAGAARALAAPERGERNTQPAGKLAQTGGARGTLVGRCDHDAAA